MSIALISGSAGLIGAPVIPVSVTNFSLARISNYLQSVVLVFERGRFRRSMEMLRFLSVVLVGLGFNTLLVWCFVYRFLIHPAAAKIVAVPIVLIWNYLGRRLFVFGNDIPVAVRAWLKAPEAELESALTEFISNEHCRQCIETPAAAELTGRCYSTYGCRRCRSWIHAIPVLSVHRNA
jgi:putative flippase GtrA